MSLTAVEKKSMAQRVASSFKIVKFANLASEMLNHRNWERVSHDAATFVVPEGTFTNFLVNMRTHAVEIVTFTPTGGKLPKYSWQFPDQVIYEKDGANLWSQDGLNAGRAATAAWYMKHIRNLQVRSLLNSQPDGT